MSIKVAVASSDGKFINQHFGRSRQFLVFLVNKNGEGDFAFVETRFTNPVCSSQQHDERLLDALAELLQDCQFVLVSQIGPGAVRALEARGVTALAHPAFIDEALNKLGRFARRLKPGLPPDIRED